ncbi:DUF1788 domain-containing protein [Anoxynatronum buryatiense]|uniref:DUF1788 domain-containing protein n=1 Tax=Anoxynatronum buryatiense TaxID=489973 RepID=A0AA45WZL4_9CLOT|nr:DUF1788 domain-containing protein [Anoxynatronum buryatiense]SMP72062.1 protein of unknown function [Anoxynatronum buryatiense]
MKTIYQRLDKILDLILDKRFRENKGLGNEIGYYIFDYDPKDELIVRDHIQFLKKKTSQENPEITIREFDLFHVMVNILKEKGYLDKVFQMEAQKGTEAILTPIKKTLRLANEDSDLIVEHIKYQVQPNNVVFITGVGKAWPIIRSHGVLNRLHAAVDHVPLVMFYPGLYSGQELRLFEEISDQNYYRAFKLVER